MTDHVAERWIEHVWDEEDITFSFEVASGGIVLRQVEVVTSTGRPQSASDRGEVTAALRSGGAEAVVAYERRYGGLSDQPLPETDEPLGTAMSRERFEQVWRRARETLEASG